MVPLVRHLSPFSALSLGLSLLARIETGTAIHACTEDAGSVAGHSQIEHIGFVPRYPLRLTVVLAAVDADVASRVS